jgi:AcrR family transcriptional regulator
VIDQYILMSPRRYAMDKRARTSGETRRRIVEATYALHAERGIADTTMKDIAERADVGLGTVYHHFPAYDDVVRACGTHTLTVSAPPDVTLFGDAKSLEQRVLRLAESLFAFYERCPGIAKARADQHKIAALQEWTEQWNAAYAGLIAEALRPAGDAAAVSPVVGALLDFDVYARFITAGFSSAQAASLVAGMIIAWIRQPQTTARRTAKPRRNT